MKGLKLIQRICTIGLLSILTIWFCIAFPFAAQAVSCGDTITTDTTLTSDIGPCSDTAIIIGADNITLNCNDHTISCSGSSCFINIADGILLNSRTGVTITNCQITGFETGFHLLFSSKNTLKGNSTILNSQGFLLDFSNNNTLSGNTGTSDILSSFFLSVSSNNTLKENTVFRDQVAGFWITNSSSNNTLIENIATENSFGFLVQFSSNNNTLNGNTALNNSSYGFSLTISSTNNTLNKNTACSNGIFNVLQDSSSTGNVFNPNNKFCPPNSF